MAGSDPWITLGRTVEKAAVVFRDPAKEIHTVEDADGVAAFLILDMRGPLSGYIQSVGVRPDRRGEGLGTELIRWAETRIATESPNVFLCVSSFNPDALRLYERLGYMAVGRLTDFIVSDHDEILLRKSIGPWNGFVAGDLPGLKADFTAYRARFDEMKWVSPIPGVRHKLHSDGRRVLRLVEYTEEMAPHWCEKGHVGLILEGRFQIDFPEETHIFEPGDGVFIPSGYEHRHRARALGGTVRALFVEEP